MHPVTISLVRHADYTRVAALDPRTGSLRVTRRRWAVDPHGIGAWRPVVPEHGWFDWLGGKVVALYRDPPWEGPLYLQIADHRFELDDDVCSRLIPRPDARRTDLLGFHRRCFRLSRQGTVVVEHGYRPRRTFSRLLDWLDPVPAWPTDESTYDLLCFIDDLLDFRDRRFRILRDAHTAPAFGSDSCGSVSANFPPAARERVDR